MRTITASEFMALDNESTVVLDIRREDDYAASDSAVSGATWRDPSLTAEWKGALSGETPVIVYCVRGGGVSNSVVDQLQADGINARYVEGGIVALQEAGCNLVSK